MIGMAVYDISPNLASQHTDTGIQSSSLCFTDLLHQDRSPIQGIGRQGLVLLYRQLFAIMEHLNSCQSKT